VAGPTGMPFRLARGPETRSYTGQTTANGPVVRAAESAEADGWVNAWLEGTDQEEGQTQHPAPEHDVGAPPHEEIEREEEKAHEEKD
jgi:hypothetical protein